MGVCLSKGGHPHDHHHHHPHPSHMFATDEDGFCTPEGVSSQYESPNPSGRYSFAHLETPRCSADVGDFGVLGSLFYKRGSRSRDGGHSSNGSGGLGLGMGSGLASNFISPLDMFLGGVSGRNRVHHVNQICTGDYSFASYLASPLLKGFDVHAMEAVAKSYAESAAKAAARDTFVFLEENDVSVTTFPCNGGGRGEAGVGNASRMLSPVVDAEGNEEEDVDDDLAKSEESEDWHEPAGNSENWVEVGATPSVSGNGVGFVNSGARKASESSRSMEKSLGSISPSFRAENGRGTSDRWDSVLNAVQARAKARRRQRKRSGAEGGAEDNERKIQSGRGRSKNVRFRLDSGEEANHGHDLETTEGEASMTDEDFRSGRESDFDDDRERGFLSDPSDIGRSSSRRGGVFLRRPVEEAENERSGAAAAVLAHSAAAGSPAVVGERESTCASHHQQHRHGGEEKVRVEEEIKDTEFGGFSALEVLGGLRASASEVLDGLRVGVVEPTRAPVLSTGGEDSSAFPRPRLQEEQQQQHHHLHVHQPPRESFSSAESTLPEISFGSSSHEPDEVSTGSARAGWLLEEAAVDSGENFGEHADRGESSCATTDSLRNPLPTNFTDSENESEEEEEAGAAAAVFSSAAAAHSWPQESEAQDQQHGLGFSSSSVKDISVPNDLPAHVAADEEHGAGSAVLPAPPAIQVGCVVVETRLADGSRLNPQILDLKEVQLPERGEHNHGLFHPRILSGGEDEDEDFAGSDDVSSVDHEGGFSFPVLVGSSSITPSIPVASRPPERSLGASFPSSTTTSSTATTTATFRELESPPTPPRDIAWEDARGNSIDLETPPIKSRTIRLYATQQQRQQQQQGSHSPASPPPSFKAKREGQDHIFSQRIFTLPQIADSEDEPQEQQQQQPPAARSSFSFDVEPTVPPPEMTHEIVLPTLPTFSTSGRSTKPSPVFNPSPKGPHSSAVSSTAASFLPSIQVSSIPYPAKARRTFNKKLKFYSLERASYAASGAKRSKSPAGGLCRDGQRGAITSGETDGESESDLFEIETMSGTNAMGSSRTPPSTPTQGQSPPGPGSKVPSNNAFDIKKLTDSIARVSRSRSKRRSDSNLNSRAGSKAVHAEELKREGDGVFRGSSGASKGSGMSQSYLKGRALLKLGFLMRSNRQVGGQRRYPHSRSDHSRDSDVCGSGETSASEYLENKPPSPGATVSATSSARYHHQSGHVQHHRGGSQCCGVEEERASSGHHSFPQHQNYSTYAFDWYCSSMPHKVTPIVPLEKRRQHQGQESFTSHTRSFSNEDRTFAVKN